MDLKRQLDERDRLTTAVRTVTACLVAALAVGYITLDLVETHGEYLYDDLGDWQIAAHPTLDEYLAQVTPRDAERPFRLSLRLGRAPQPEDSVTASRVFAADPGARHCLDLFISGVGKPGRQAFRAGVWVNGERAVWVTPQPPPAYRARVEDIAPADGHIELRFEVRSVARGSGPASRVDFQFARLAPCPTGG